MHIFWVLNCSPQGETRGKKGIMLNVKDSHAQKKVGREKREGILLRMEKSC